MPIYDEIVELNEYADQCNDEYGEFCRSICNLIEYYSDFLSSEDIRKSLENEIIRNLRNFRENSKIVTRKVTQEYQELVWK